MILSVCVLIHDASREPVWLCVHAWCLIRWPLITVATYMLLGQTYSAHLGREASTV
jgi:hypothetical protein